MKKYTRATLIAAFLAGIIIGHASSPIAARAHSNSNSGDAEHVAKYLDEINDTLKKISQQMKP